VPEIDLPSSQRAWFRSSVRMTKESLLYPRHDK
jgi:hypothetical protein